MKKLVIIINILVIICFNSSVYANNLENQVEIDLSQKEIRPGDTVEITIKLLDITNVLYTYSGEIEYDKEVFQEINNESFIVANLWENLKYNNENGKFIVTSKGSNGNEEILKVKLISKNNIKKTNAKINIKNLKTVNEITNQEICSFNVEQINIDINQENNIDKNNGGSHDKLIGEELPQTGKNSYIEIIIFIMVLISVFLFFRYRKISKMFLIVLLCLIIPSNKYVNAIQNLSSVEIKGDLNLDQKIDNDDIELLEEYLIELENLSNMQIENADIYEDNIINLLDLHYLIKQINNKELNDENNNDNNNKEDIVPKYDFNQISPNDSKVTYEPIVMTNQKMQEYGTSGAGSQWPVSLETSKDGNLMLYGIDVAGLFKSTDHGKTWTRANSGITSNGVGMFAIDPHNINHIATLGLSEYSNVGGIHISYDKAETWTKTYQIGIKGYRYLWDGLEFDPTSYDLNKKYSTDLYFSTPYKRDTQIRTNLTDNRSLTKLTEEEIGLYKSEDCGETFTLIINDPKVADGIIRFTDDGNLYIGNQYGLFLIDKANKKIEKSYFENNPEIDSTKGVTGLDVVGNVLYVQTWDGIFTLENDNIKKITNETYDARWPQFLTVSKTNPKHMVYQFRGDVNNYFTTLVNVTFDGGKTWQISDANMETTFYNVRFASREKVFIIDPSNDSNVITFGGDCILRSNDGGLNFIQANGISNMMQGGKFQFNYYNPDLILLSAQDYTGVISTDGGKTFSHIKMNKGNFYAGFAADENTFYGFANENWGGGTLTYTHDGGKTWTDTGLKAKYEESSALYSSLQSITNPNVLFAQEYYSKDNGYTWQEMDGCVCVFTYNYTGKKELYGANKDGNIVVSYDDGDTWELITKNKFCDSSVTEKIYDLAYDHVNNYIYAIVRENHGSWGIERIYKYDINNEKCVEFKVPRDTERGYMRFRTIAVDPKSTSVIYIGGSGDYFMSSVGLLRSVDGGETWRVLTTANNPNYEGWATNQGGYEVSCIAVEPITGKVWIASGCYGHSKFNPPY